MEEEDEIKYYADNIGVEVDFNMYHVVSSFNSMKRNIDKGE